MIEFSRLSVLQGEPELVLVPTDSGGNHWLARCPICRTAMCNEHGTRKAITRYVRVGTLDDPTACPSRAHVVARSEQAWVLVAQPTSKSSRLTRSMKVAGLSMYVCTRCASAEGTRFSVQQQRRPSRPPAARR